MQRVASLVPYLAGIHFVHRFDSESIAHVAAARLYSDLCMHGAKAKPASTDFSVVLHNQSLVFVWDSGYV